MKISFDNSKAIYLQLMDYFFQQISSEQIKPGEKLPSVRETAVEVGVNPNTVQRAYTEMERKGIVEARRGQGSFVTEDVKVIAKLRSEIAQHYIDNFINFMRNNGFSDDEIVERIKVALQ